MHMDCMLPILLETLSLQNRLIYYIHITTCSYTFKYGLTIIHAHTQCTSNHMHINSHISIDITPLTHMFHVSGSRSHSTSTHTWLSHPIRNCPYANKQCIHTSLSLNIFMPRVEFSKSQELNKHLVNEYTYICLHTRVHSDAEKSCSGPTYLTRRNGVSHIPHVTSCIHLAHIQPYTYTSLLKHTQIHRSKWTYTKAIHASSVATSHACNTKT